MGPLRDGFIRLGMAARQRLPQRRELPTACLYLRDERTTYGLLEDCFGGFLWVEYPYSEVKMQTTWEPYEKHGNLTPKSDLPDSVFAFPNERKEPLTDAEHVRNAVARFDQVTGVSDEERALAFANIEKAANYFGVTLSETSWKELRSGSRAAP
jgi:hypothetical protein